MNVAEMLGRWTHALQQIHKQSFQLARSNNGAGPGPLKKTSDSGGNGHAESLQTTLAEHRQHLANIQALIGQLKDATPALESTILTLHEEVSRDAAAAPTMRKHMVSLSAWRCQFGHEEVSRDAAAAPTMRQYMIRSHAQKYFLKVQKTGNGEHVPPPRPKRKSARPYPQKASKLGILASVQNSTSGLPSSTMPADYGFSLGSQSGAAFTSQDTSSQPVSSWIHHGVPRGTDTSGLIGNTNVDGRNGNSSDDSSTNEWSLQATPDQINQEFCLKGTPDFSEIYKFIGSTFDPGVTGHLKKLKEMASIDRETIMLLMRNLSINLSSPDFEENKLVSSPCDMNVGGQRPAVTTNVDGQVVLA